MSWLRPTLSRLFSWTSPPDGEFTYSHGGQKFTYRYLDQQTYRKLHGCLSDGEITHEKIPIEHFNITTEHDGIVDIGAHFGIYTVLLGVLNPDHRIIAFEPNDENREALEKNIATNGFDPQRVTVRPEVVAGHDGVVRFYEDPAHTTVGHTINPADRHADFRPTKRKAVRLSDVISRVGFSDPWVKIDAEGAEIEILADTFESGVEPAGFVELHPDRPNVSIDRLQNLFRKHGYEWQSVKRRYEETNPGYLFAPE